MYGYSLQDDLTGKFEFSYKEGKPFLKLLDPTIRKVAAVPETRVTAPAVMIQAAAPEETEEETVTRRLGLVFNFNAKHTRFTVQAVQGRRMRNRKISWKN